MLFTATKHRGFNSLHVSCALVCFIVAANNSLVRVYLFNIFVFGFFCLKKTQICLSNPLFSLFHAWCNLSHALRRQLKRNSFSPFFDARADGRSYQPVNLDRIRTDNNSGSGSPPNSARRSSIGSRSPPPSAATGKPEPEPAPQVR